MLGGGGATNSLSYLLIGHVPKLSMQAVQMFCENSKQDTAAKKIQALILLPCLHLHRCQHTSIQGSLARILLLIPSPL